MKKNINRKILVKITTREHIIINRCYPEYDVRIINYNKDKNGKNISGRFIEVNIEEYVKLIEILNGTH